MREENAQDVERIVAEDLDFPPPGFPRAPADMSGIRLVCIGHAHIDLGYRWDFKETVGKVAPWTFSGVLDLMDRTPGLTFCQSQMWLYREVQREFPDLFRRILGKIREGAWEAIGGAWCEYDTALPSGESIVRQHLQGAAYAAEHLGVSRHTVAFVPDSFIEHAATLPQILAGCGFRGYIFCRGVPLDPENLANTKRAFRWMGPDGSGLVAYAPFGPYSNPCLTPEYVATLSAYARSSAAPDELAFYGIGDHGGGPRDADVAALRSLNGALGAPSWAFGRADEFFERVFDAKRAAGLREHRGRLVSFSVGALASQAQIKRANRMGEWRLVSAEAVSAIGVMLQRKPASPRADLQETWRDFLTLQFHDILPGTSVASVYRDARAIYARVERKAGELLDDGLARIAARIDTRGEGAPLLVFNAGLKPLRGYARTKIPEWLPRAQEFEPVLRDAKGNPKPVVRAADELIFPFELPPLGCALHRVASGPAQPPSGTPPRWDAPVLESNAFRLEFDPATGDIASIRDRAGVELLTGPGNTLELHDEHELATSWVVVPWGQPRPLVMDSPLRIVEENAFFTTVACDCRAGFSRFTREITLYHDLRRIDFRLALDWREGNACLSIGFPLRTGEARVRAATAHGHIEIPDPGKYFCAHEWIDVGDGTRGAAVLTDGVYGARHDGRILHLLVIRTARDMDPAMGQGRHELRYSMFPYQGAAPVSAIERESGWVCPAAVCRWEPLHPGVLKAWCRQNPALPASHAFAGVDAENASICALKFPEDAFSPFAFVVRLRETDGRRTRCRVALPMPPKSVVRADHLERPSAQALPFEGREVFVELKAFEIITFMAYLE